MLLGGEGSASRLSLLAHHALAQGNVTRGEVNFQEPFAVEGLLPSSLRI